MNQINSIQSSQLLCTATHDQLTVRFHSFLNEFDSIRSIGFNQLTVMQLSFFFFFFLREGEGDELDMQMNLIITLKWKAAAATAAAPPSGNIFITDTEGVKDGRGKAGAGWEGGVKGALTFV